MSGDADAQELVRTSSSHDLVRLYRALLSELVERGVLRSRNAPAGDLAEHLAAVVFDGVLAPDSEK